MSENELDAICDEEKMLSYIYDDVDDSDIFATEPLNNSFTESDPRADGSKEPDIAQSSELIQANEKLKETVETLQKEREILELRISELYKTARAELERKDKRLKDLEKEKDNIIFRRGNCYVRNKMLAVDTMVPVLQQVEKDLPNDELKLLNARYRIPKKKNTQSDKETNETSTKHNAPSKELDDRRLGNKNIQNKNINNDKHWSAYPHLKDKPSAVNTDRLEKCNKKVEERNKQTDDTCSGEKDSLREKENFGKNSDKNEEDRDKKLQTDKNSKDRYIKDHVRPIEISDSRLKPTRMRSKSFRYRNDSPESHVRRPRSPSAERKGQLPSKRNRSKTIDEDMKLEDPLQSRSKSVGRHKPHSPEYRIRQPRTPSDERRQEELSIETSRLRSNDEHAKFRDKRIHSSPATKEKKYLSSSKRIKCRSENEKTTYDRKHRLDYRSTSMEKESNIQFSRQTDRSRSRNRKYARRDFRSGSQEKEDGSAGRLNNSEGKKDDLKGKDNVGGCNATRSKSRDKDVRNSRRNNIKVINRKYDSNKKPSRSSSRESMKSRDRGESKFDLREKCPRRSRSVSCARDRRRGLKRSRSSSKERGGRRSPERDSYRRNRGSKITRYCQNSHRGRSRSSSVERGMRDKNETLLRRGRLGNVSNCRYRRSRSKSRERPINFNAQELQNREGKSKATDFGRLRERLLRHSVDRENHILRHAKKNDKRLENDSHRNHMIKEPTTNETDQSDLDDLKLHLSGESDFESVKMENTKEQRDKYVSTDDDAFEMLKDLGEMAQDMTDEQLERFLEDKKKLYNKLNNLTNLHGKYTGTSHGDFGLENFNATFSPSVEESTDGESHDSPRQVYRKINEIGHFYDEELDYEVSQSEFTCKKAEIVQGYEEPETLYIDKNSEDIFWNTSKATELAETETKSVECNQFEYRTLYGARQRFRGKNVVKDSVQVKRNQENIEITHEKPSNSICEKPPVEEKKKQAQVLETQKLDKCTPENKNIHGLDKDIHEFGQGPKKAKGQNLYENMIKNIQNCKQVCTSTLDEVCVTRSKVTKSTDVNKKRLSEDYFSKLDPDEEKRDDIEEEKIFRKEENEITHIDSKKREKITLNAYKSRRPSTKTCVTESVCQNEVGGPSRDDEESTNTRLNCNKKLSLSNVDSTSNKLPKTGDICEESSKNKNVANKVNSEGNVVQNAEEINKPKVPIKDYFIAAQKSDSDSDDTVLSKQENSSHNDRSSFLHDLSISDDDDVPEHLPTSKEEHLLIESDKKINILSDITIQNLSYTPHPKDFNISYTPPRRTKDNDLNEVKSEEIKNKSCRKSLIQIIESEGNMAVTNILEMEDKSVYKSDNMPLLVPKLTGDNRLQASENIPRGGKIDSKKINNLQPPHENTECLEEIQKAVANVMVDLSHNSSTVASNIITEQFDTEALQKCLEEDMPQANDKDLNFTTANLEKKKLSCEPSTAVCKKEIDGGKGSIKKEDDEHKSKENKRKREQKQKINNGAVTERFKEEQFEKEKIMLKEKEKRRLEEEEKLFNIFGSLSPSPCKSQNEISEENTKRDIVKRNIVKCELAIDDNSSFKVRDKSEDTNKSLLKDKVLSEDNKNPNNDTEIRSESIEEKIIVGIISPEDLRKYKPLSEQVEKKKNELGFGNNPTYIPTSKEFDSPVHFMKKKIQEKEENKAVVQNLFKNNLEKRGKKENTMHTTDIVKNKVLEEKSHPSTSTSEEVLSEECYNTKKVKRQKHKLKKKTKDNEHSKKEEDEKRVHKAIAERKKKNLEDKNAEDKRNLKLKSKQIKKSLNQTFSADDKKPRTSSFKIKLSSSKRQRGNAKENIRNKKRKFVFDESSCSSDESDKISRRNQTDKNQKQEIEEKDVDLKVSKDPAHLDQIKKLVETESRKVMLKKKEKKHKLKETKVSGEKSKKNIQEETCARVKEGETDNCQKIIEIKKSSHTAAGNSKKNIEINQEILKEDDKQPESKNFEEKSSSTNSNIKDVHESVKPIKRITPKRIGDSSFRKEKEQKFKELKAKRELFLESREPEIGNKRKRPSYSSDECIAEKYRKVTYTESEKTVEEVVMDNGAHTQIKVHETQLNIEVAPNCSPLPRIEQTYDTLSKNKALSKNSTSDTPFINPEIVQLRLAHDVALPVHITDSTFPEISVDTKDLGPIEKDFYDNFSEFSMFNKSTLFSNESKSKSEKDSGDADVAAQSEKNEMDRYQLNFSNLLNSDSKTSTPIRNREAGSKDEACMSSVREETYSKEVVNISHQNIELQLDSRKSVTSEFSGGTLTNPLTTSSKPVSNRKVSDSKTLLEMTSSMSNDSSVSRTHVRFSRTLKRDRRRPISVMVID